MHAFVLVENPLHIRMLSLLQMIGLKLLIDDVVVNSRCHSLRLLHLIISSCQKYDYEINNRAPYSLPLSYFETNWREHYYWFHNPTFERNKQLKVIISQQATLSKWCHLWLQNKFSIKKIKLFTLIYTFSRMLVDKNPCFSQSNSSVYCALV